MARTTNRPRAISTDDPRLRIDEAEPVPAPLTDEPALPARVPVSTSITRGMRWGGLLLSALTGLVWLAASLWLAALVQDLLARQDWIGWVSLGLLALAGFAALMIGLRELWALARLARLGRIRHDADSAILNNDKPVAVGTARRLKRLYGSREDMAWRRARFAEHESDIMDARELLTLAERELVAPLDAQARAIIASSARRVSVLTAISPAALIDMAFVAVENLRMLRRLAACYGARPGAFALFKLARMVLTHIVLTGGIALGDDVIQQLIGHGLTARLSARLGEGVFNGALTTRIGIAAIDVCRPLPWIEATRPRFRDLVAQVAGMRS